MKQRFKIDKVLPCLNDMIKASANPRWGAKKYSLMKREWQDYIGWAIKSSKIVPIKKVKIDFTWVEKDKRRDPDNICAAKKFILDSIVEMGILKNDGWSEIITMTDHFAVNKNEPCVIVDLDDLEEIIHPVNAVSQYKFSLEKEGF